MNSVNVVYERDCDLSHLLSHVIVRSNPADPYDSTDATALYDQLRNHWNSAQTAVQRDMVHLMTGKNLDGGTIGYAAVGAVCSRTRGYGLSETRFSSNLGRRTALVGARARPQLERRSLRRRRSVSHHVLEPGRMRRHRNAELRAHGNQRHSSVCRDAHVSRRRAGRGDAGSGSRRFPARSAHAQSVHESDEPALLSRERRQGSPRHLRRSSDTGWRRSPRAQNRWAGTSARGAG